MLCVQLCGRRIPKKQQWSCKTILHTGIRIKRSRNRLKEDKRAILILIRISTWMRRTRFADFISRLSISNSYSYPFSVNASSVFDLRFRSKPVKQSVRIGLFAYIGLIVANSCWTKLSKLYSVLCVAIFYNSSYNCRSERKRFTGPFHHRPPCWSSPGPSAVCIEHKSRLSQCL